MSRVKALSTLGLGVGALLVAGSAGAVQTAQPEIAFLRGDELWVMNGDGSDQRKLADGVRPRTAPAWSRDGRMLAFVTNRDGNAEIYAIDADGSGERRLTQNPTYDGDPTWSPDGQAIAFRRNGVTPGRVVYSELYVMKADGSEQRALSGRGDAALGVTRDVRPAWSPDGARIAFVRLTPFTRPKPPGSRPPGPIFAHHRDLYVVNADGSGRRSLTRGPAYDLTPVWSIDGRKIRFGRLLVNADGSDRRSLPRIIPVTGGAWSPDGGKIAFGRASERVGTPGANRDVYVVNADGSGLRRLTTHPEYDGDPAWSPDGRKIAFLSRRDGRSEIYVMNSDGSREQRLTRSAADESWFAWS